MPLDSAYWPVAGESTFCPSTSAPAATRLSAAFFSFAGSYQEFVQTRCTFAPGVHQLCAERERVRVPDDFGDRERDDIADVAALRRGAGRHPGEEDRVFRGAEVFRKVRRRVGACRLLEVDLRVLRGERLVEVAVRRAEDHLVALVDEARDGLLQLRADRDVLLVRRL